MDPTLVREYKARYDAVAEIEAAEQRQTTLEERLQKLNRILEMAVALGFDVRSQSDDDAVVWERWAKLKLAAEHDAS